MSKNENNVKCPKAQPAVFGWLIELLFRRLRATINGEKTRNIIIMTRLIFVRHGQSEANEKGFFAGHTDVTLTPLGLKQAEELKGFILKNYKIDGVYSSDLTRACQTIQPTAEGLNLPIIKDESLREINGGKWEGLSIEEIAERYPNDYFTWHSDIGLSCCTGGESVKELQKRAIAAVSKIATENSGKTLLICTHGCFLRAMQCYWQDSTLEQMKDVEWVPNASVTEVIYDNGGIRTLRVGETSFLTGVTRLCEGM